LFKIHKNGAKNYVLDFHKKVDFVSEELYNIIK
jgi:hypothetical protein